MDTRSARRSEQPPPVALVADDDPTIAQLVKVCLRDDGFEVVMAQDGREALAAEADAEPDVIILDLDMPVLDGASVFRELRSRGRNEPVLILSAHGARRVAQTLGAEDAMEKPFDPETLVERVHALLDSRTSRSSRRR